MLFRSAIRLPNTAFKANAGTEVTSDIIFLQKRDRAIDIVCRKEIPFYAYHKGEGAVLFGGVVCSTSNAF